MHAEVMAFVELVRAGIVRIEQQRVLELGSRNVNGSPRELFRGCEKYVGVDLEPGPGVDAVMDCRAFDGKGTFDVCLCLESMEHERDPEIFIRAARRALKPGGLLIVTAAAPPRKPHSCIGGSIGSEYYTNIFPVYLREILSGWASVNINYNASHGDVYATAVAP